MKIGTKYTYKNGIQCNLSVQNIINLIREYKSELDTVVLYLYTSPSMGDVVLALIDYINNNASDIPRLNWLIVDLDNEEEWGVVRLDNIKFEKAYHSKGDNSNNVNIPQVDLSDNDIDLDEFETEIYGKS